MRSPRWLSLTPHFPDHFLTDTHVAHIFWSEAALRRLGGLTMIDISGEEWQIDSGGIASPKVNDDWAQ